MTTEEFKEAIEPLQRRLEKDGDGYLFVQVSRQDGRAEFQCSFDGDEWMFVLNELLEISGKWLQECVEAHREEGQRRPSAKQGH